MDRGRDRCEALLRGLVKAWDAAQLATALAAAAKWNTNGRHCHAAHALLKAIFLEHPLEVRLMALSHLCMPSLRDSICK